MGSVGRGAADGVEGADGASKANDDGEEAADDKVAVDVPAVDDDTVRDAGGSGRVVAEREKVDAAAADNAPDNRNNPCPHCPARYARKGNLLQHMAQNHLEDMSFPSSLGPVAPCGGAGPPVSASRRRGGTPALATSASLLHGSRGSRDAENVVDGTGGAAAHDKRPIGSIASMADGAACPEVNTTSQKVREYYAAFGDMARTQPLVDPRNRDRPSDFVSDELKDMRMFALSAGGRGLSQKARAEYYTSCVAAERAALRSQHASEAAQLANVVALLSEHETALDSDGSSEGHECGGKVPVSGSGDPDCPSCAGRVAPAPPGAAAASVPRTVRPTASVSGVAAGGSPTRARKKSSLRRRIKAALVEATANLQAVIGPLETAFPSASAFVNSLQGEASRCLAEQHWRKTDIVDGKDVHVFYSRDVMVVALAAFMRATKVCLRGVRKYGPDGSVLRTGSLDGDLYIREQADVDCIHSGKMHDGKELPVFTMATQFFSDATLVSKNGGKRQHVIACLDPISIFGVLDVWSAGGCDSLRLRRRVLI